MICRACREQEVGPDGPPDFDVCRSCASKGGLIAMPPPRRPALPCARCNGTHFIRVIPRELTATGDHYVHKEVGPMTLTYGEVRVTGLVRSHFEVAAPSIGNGHGLVETYVCRGCGFIEWYCIDPESIPIGPEYMTQQIEYVTR
jgi:hypothetical protein